MKEACNVYSNEFQPRPQHLRNSDAALKDYILQSQMITFYLFFIVTLRSAGVYHLLVLCHVYVCLVNKSKYLSQLPRAGKSLVIFFA